MTREEIIHDLQAIAEYFIMETGGSVPMCLEEAIKILKEESKMDYKGYAILPNYNSQSPETKYNIMYFDNLLGRWKISTVCGDIERAKAIIDKKIEEESNNGL